MSKFHVDAVFDQFHWLNEHFANAKSNFTDAKVGKFNLETLDLRAGHWASENRGNGNKQLYLFSVAGKHIANVHPRARWYHEFFEGEWMRSVGEALNELGVRANEVSFAVAVNGYEITVYTPPKNTTVLELLNEKKRLCAIEVARAKKEIGDYLAS